MNGKKAKALRRMSREATVCQPEASYIVTRHRPRHVMVGVWPHRRPFYINCNQASLHNGCTRSFNKMLKRMYSRHQQSGAPCDLSQA